MYTLIKGMLDFPHLGDIIGPFQKLRGRIPACQGHLQAFRTVLQKIQGFFPIQHAVIVAGHKLVHDQQESIFLHCPLCGPVKERLLGGCRLLFLFIGHIPEEAELLLTGQHRDTGQLPQYLQF